MAGHYDGFVPIHCIFYSVFHPTEGTKVRYEFPPGCIAASGINFDTIKNYIIPKPQLCNKLLTFKYGSYRLVCYPVNVVAPFYARNSFNFNFVFVFPYECATTPYEPAIARLGKMFRVLEEQSQILSKAELDQVYYHLKSDDAKGDQNNGMDMPDEKDRLKDSLGSVKPKDKTYIFEKYQEIISDLNKSDRKLSVKDLITKIYQDLNNYSECLIPIDSGNSVDTKLFPLLTPPNSCFSFEDVPIATVNLSKLIDVNWDPTMLKIIPYINGINSISKIAHCSDSNVELVIECVKHLIYYHCVVLVDIFQFSNIYAPTSDLEKFLSDPSVASACQAYVSFPDNSPINDLPFTRKPQASMKKQNQSSISIDSSRRKSVSSRAGSMSSDADSLDLKHRSLSSRGSSVPLASVSDASLSSSNRFKPNGREYATKSSLFDLYRSFQQGQTVKDWYALNYEKIKLGNVDVRRLISFGLIHGLIYRCYAYPITKSMSFLGIAKALNSLDDFKETKGQQHRRPHKLNVLSTADIQVGIEHDKRGELRLLGKHKSNSQLADEVLQEVYRKLAPNKLLAGGINSESTISLATDDTGSRDTTFRKEKSDPTLLNRGNKVAFDIKERSPLSQIQMEGFHRNELSVLRPRKREEFVLLQSLKQAESLDKICTRLDKDRKAVTGMIKDLGSYHIVNC
ncbi:LAMI_0B07976g1_1 [Lachancea mirantina]|uniref:LAMI_0B07976g1_1 n=1 Tax=Lachancea mirantina TaxID=1230905 RepID=A0A1G4IXT1_9SACH|nr:LAMI_0B07976g1_1 [Lachancea mirantina]